MFENLSILITAVGSELAFAVIKACRLFDKPVKLVGCDMADEVLGKYWCDDFEVVPCASKEKKYVASLSDIVKGKNIKIIIPTADVELPLLSKYKKYFLDNFGCHILINELDEINRFTDKWHAYEWYVAHNISAPKTFLADDLSKIEFLIDDLRYPVILKPRFGGGSRALYKASSWKEVVKFQPVVPNPIIQEYIFPDDEEYTAGTYRDSNNKVQVIVLKRTLKFGMTYTAQTIQRKSLEEFCRRVILNTNLIGSNNIQFRVAKDGPKVLEINPRFSSTTGIRAYFGFNDVEMWIADVLGVKPIKEPVLKKGKVFRYMHEEFIDE